MSHTREEAKQIAIHVEMLLDDEMRRHAYADAKAHDLPFQIFRVLGGYRLALTERAELLTLLSDLLNEENANFFPSAIELDHPGSIDFVEWRNRARSLLQRIEAAR